MSATTVTIICRDPSHYPPRTERITTFTRAAAGWDEHTRRRRTINLDERREMQAPEFPTAAILDGDTVVHDPRSWADHMRLRYELTCRRCGVDVPARAEQLVPILDRLADENTRQITLAGLAARLA